MRMSRVAGGLVLVLGLLVVGGGALGTQPAGGATYRNGIDVSHHNGTIDWRRAYADGKRFVFMKATEAQWFRDDRYAGNRSGARAAGFKVGAYHFARMDPSARDAVLEADHFLAHARPVAGDLLPVLDLEIPDARMSHAERRQWIRQWLRRVERRIGVKAILYSNRSFWRDELGDPQSFAKAGHRLWLAHWTTGSPSVPAANWAGRGLTFWQHSDCGSVSGLSGCVDLDRYAGSSFSPVLIPSG